MTLLDSAPQRTAVDYREPPQTGQRPSPPRTVVPDRGRLADVPRRRRLGIIRRSDVFAVVGALAAATATTALLWTQLTPLTGALGYVVATWVLFVVLYAALVSFDERRQTVVDRVVTVVVHSLAAVVLLALGFIVIYTVLRGLKAMTHANFYTSDMHTTWPLAPLTSGGILHAIVGTLIEVGIALAVAVPLGLLGAVFLNEVPGRYSRFVRTVVEAMTALPDLLAGLFIYATLILIFGLDLSGLAAAIALALTVLPIVIRASDVVLRLVPGGLKEASYAMGTGQWRTVWFVTLPTARSGLATAVILGAARAIGETSPVLITAGAASYTNTNPVRGPMMSLPLFAYQAVQNSQPNIIARGFGAAAVLMLLVIAMFALARAVGGRGAGNLSTRQLRRRGRRSRRDIERITARVVAPVPAVQPGFGPTVVAR